MTDAAKDAMRFSELKLNSILLMLWFNAALIQNGVFLNSSFVNLKVHGKQFTIEETRQLPGLSSSVSSSTAIKSRFFLSGFSILK